jgi:hypothetical protein
MKIIKLEDSPLKNKRFRVHLDNGERYDFGLKGAKTYLDGVDDKTRENYLKRHLTNPLEKQLITNFTPSPALFSAYLIWGKSRNINENIKYLNSRLNI